MLRVATSIVFLVDPGSVMTDAGRTPEDYYLWGLPVNEASLHFQQDDGFVHAVDGVLGLRLPPPAACGDGGSPACFVEVAGGVAWAAPHARHHRPRVASAGLSLSM